MACNVAAKPQPSTRSGLVGHRHRGVRGNAIGDVHSIDKGAPVAPSLVPKSQE